MLLPSVCGGRTRKFSVINFWHARAPRAWTGPHPFAEPLAYCSATTPLSLSLFLPPFLQRRPQLEGECSGRERACWPNCQCSLYSAAALVFARASKGRCWQATIRRRMRSQPATRCAGAAGRQPSRSCWNQAMPTGLALALPVRRQLDRKPESRREEKENKRGIERKRERKQ